VDPRVFISAVVEGDVDDAVARRLISLVGAGIGPVHVKYGKSALVAKLPGYNAAARHSPWLVLIDLDDDAECAPAYVDTCVPDRSTGLCFRVAVREVESWLLADRERIARFLSVPIRLIPGDPDRIPNPKATMVDLASRSRRRDIRLDMVPRLESGRNVGPAYNSRLVEFVRDRQHGWRPERGARASTSLEKCIASLRGLAH
jgi:hypothetical protein